VDPIQGSTFPFVLHAGRYTDILEIMENLIEKIKQTIENESLFAPGDTALVMLSGGGDSVALLRALTVLSGEFGINLHALHVNHLIRKETADADEAFAAALCGELGVPCTVERIDVGAFAQANGLNLEDAGRRVRYTAAEKLVERLCEQKGARRSQGKIVTGHSLDDRVETFFSRALFGAGTGGLGSTRAKRGAIVRPLIGCERRQLREWLSANGFSWREDESNEDVTRTRAFIRSNIVPVCEELNPSFRGALERTMDLLSDDDALLSAMANQFARDFSDDRVVGEHIVFNISFMRTLEQTMARRTLRSGILQMFPEASRMDASHIQNLVDHFDCDSYVQDLPDNLRAEVRYGTLKVTKKRPVDTWEDTVLDVEGETDLGAAGKLYLEEVGADEISADPFSATVDADVFLGSLSAGPARTGERMHPLGMEGSKLLSDVFIDAKVPKEQRALVPVIRDASQVVWVAGRTLDDRYKITKETKRAWRIEWVAREEL